LSFESLTAPASELPVVGVFVRALVKSQHDHSKDMAASIAYFSFFSIFPFLLGVIAVGSFFVDLEVLGSRLDQLLANALPGSAGFVRDNVEALVRLRGAAGAAGVAGLFWSASKMAGAVSRGINRALETKRTHAVYLSPLRNFAMTVAISILLFLAISVSTALELVAQSELGEQLALFWTFAGGHATSYVFVFVIMMLLYALVPYEKLPWTEILPAALFAALLFEVGKAGFVLYLDNVAHLEAVYGSVSSIIVLLLWLYFSARVVLLGSELIAVRREETSHVDP